MNLTDEQIDAMEAGLELDALMAECVMGWKSGGKSNSGNAFFPKQDGDRIGRGKENWRFHPWDPSSDISSAWRVAEHVMAHPGVFASELLMMDNKRFGIYLGDDEVVSAYADTAPLAICRAALKWARRRA